MASNGHTRAPIGAPGGAAADPLTGRLLDGRYRVGARVARGGMASVYEATDIRLDRTVAVKVMHPGLGDDEEFAARFVREARAAARLSHPNVVSVHDQGNDDGVVFLAMELVEGHTLRDTISKESPMSPMRALALIEPVLSALAAAHRAGLIHRDVKPENVLIADDGRVKVADFGLAKAVSAETQHTATGGVLIGTVSYLAPELVVDGRADARADVYAAGVVLYELLTGRKPHEGESPIQVAYKHVHADVPPPSATVPGLPPYVDALVARATARDREQRPADAAVLLHHVHRVAQALADGVRDDEDLTADLLPRSPVADGPEPTARLLLGRPGDTSPEIWDAEQLGRVLDPPAPPAPSTALAPGSAPPPRSPEPAAPRRPHRSRRGLVLLLVALLLAGGIGAGAWWFGSGRYTAVPGVVSLREAAAVDKLEAAGLEAEVGDPAYSETVPAGVVIATDPGAGAQVLDGDTVTITVSLGKERYTLPKLAGLTEDQAKAELADLNLSYGTSTPRYSEKVPEGVVLSSKPDVGKVLSRGANVDLVVSQGRRPRPVGDWVGKPYDRAAEKLEARGLVPTVTDEQYSDAVPQGDVIGQDPVGGTLFRGDSVSFTVSLGPELVEMPNVRAAGVEAARDQLEDLGFEVETRESDAHLGLGYVFSSDPGAGEMVPKGSTVTLTII
ncbi:Stk1 family PASTA domain-containing Ser/Thr kinase [Nocardioides dongkuii]|uniref:Stk1 family PASTA domain-containing Ser/Thr kinase n=1 Tax=Nocardioides dongkuii TaxID=2760089 RepID=UPI001FD15F50|nr:Stk1 family PASTA domain-containing Ser/Thr kinase [Nocardioides dongkuii]